MSKNTTLLHERDLQKVSVEQKIGKFLVKFMQLEVAIAF